MPYVFLAVGLALAITAIEGTYNAFGKQLKQDFTDKQGFQWWALAILLVGSLGYISAIRPVSNKLLWLVLIALFLSNAGAWGNLVSSFKQGPITPKKSTNAATLGAWQTSAVPSAQTSGGWQTSTVDNSSSDQSKLSKDLGIMGKLAPLAAMFF